MTRGNDRHNRKNDRRRQRPGQERDGGGAAGGSGDAGGQVPWWERRYGQSEAGDPGRETAEQPAQRTGPQPGPQPSRHPGQQTGQHPGQNTGQHTGQNATYNTGQNTAYGANDTYGGGGTSEFNVAAFRESAGTGRARDGRGREGSGREGSGRERPGREGSGRGRSGSSRRTPEPSGCPNPPPQAAPPSPPPMPPPGPEAYAQDPYAQDPYAQDPYTPESYARTVSPEVSAEFPPAPARVEPEPSREPEPPHDLEPDPGPETQASHHHAAVKKPPVARGPRWLPTGLDLQILTWWVITRVSLLMVSVSGPALLAPPKGEPGFLQRWMSWDFAHFNRIAQFGYFDPEWKTPTEAFFPGLPMLMKLGAPFGDNGTVIVGLLVSFVAGGIAAVALGRLAESEYGAGVGMKAAIAWMVAPPAVFLAAPYTESLFLGLAIPAWLAARKGHWWLTGVFAMGACAVRVSGVFLVVALLVEFATSRRKGNLSNVFWLALSAVPLLGYMGYLWSRTGDPLRWYHAQESDWFRKFTFPWDSLINTIKGATGTLFGKQDPATLANWSWMFSMELLAMLVGVVLTVVLLTLRRWGEMVWVGLQVLAFSTSMFFFSVPRATLLWFPLWMGLGAVMANRPRLWQLYLVIVLPLFGLWATAYFLYKWAG